MTATEIDPREVTPERAAMLAAHAIHVQGGFSTPEIEAERARKDMSAEGSAPIDWDRMQAELTAALMAKVPAASVLPPAAATGDPDDEPATTGEQVVNVTAVLANVDQGEAIRDRIKTLTAELKIHEDMIKDALGDATVGVDGAGHVVVRYPFRNRSGLVKAKVKAALSAKKYAECETVTTYRSLHYGES